MLAVKNLALVFFLLLTCPAWAQSQETQKSVPPITDKGKGSEKSKQNPNGQNTKTEDLTPPINVTIGGNLEIESHNNNDERGEEGPNATDWLIVFFTGCLVAVTAPLAWYTRKLWKSTLETSIRQAQEMHDSLTTAKQSADAAKTSAEAAMQSARSMHAADRAFIKMSHTSPPGLFRNAPLQYLLYGNTTLTYEIEIEIGNIGKTIAFLTGLRFIPIITADITADPLPVDSPDPSGSIRTILYPNDTFKHKTSFDISSADDEDITHQRKTFYIFGITDYIDHSGRHYRATYTRRYNHSLNETGNNLSIVPLRWYNDDYERQPGQGDDWNEPNT